MPADQIPIELRRILFYNLNLVRQVDGRLFFAAFKMAMKIRGKSGLYKEIAPVKSWPASLNT